MIRAGERQERAVSRGLEAAVAQWSHNVAWAKSHPLFLGPLFLPQAELQEAENQRNEWEVHGRDGGKRHGVAESKKAGSSRKSLSWAVKWAQHKTSTVSPPISNF